MKIRWSTKLYLKKSALKMLMGLLVISGIAAVSAIKPALKRYASLPFGSDAEAGYNLQNDGSQNQNGAVIGKKDAYRRGEQGNVEEKPQSVAASHLHDAQGSPLEESHGIQRHRQRHDAEERQRRIPNVEEGLCRLPQTDRAQQERGNGADSSRVTQPQTEGALNHQEKRHCEDGYCSDCDVIQDCALPLFRKALSSGIKN